MEFLIGFIIGVALMRMVIGIYQMVQQHKRDAWKKEIAENLAELEEHLKKITILRAEKVGEVIYVYNQITNEFICQGKDIEEVNAAWLARNPGKHAFIDEGRDLLFKEDTYVTK